MDSRFSSVSSEKLERILRCALRPHWPELLQHFDPKPRRSDRNALAPLCDENDAPPDYEARYWAERPPWVQELSLPSKTLSALLTGFCASEQTAGATADRAKAALEHFRPRYAAAIRSGYKVFQRTVVLGAFEKENTLLAAWRFHLEIKVPSVSVSHYSERWQDEAVYFGITYLDGWFPSGVTSQMSRLLSNSIAGLLFTTGEALDEALDMADDDYEMVSDKLIPIQAEAMCVSSMPGIDTAIQRGIAEAERVCNAVGTVTRDGLNHCYVGCVRARDPDAAEWDRARGFLNPPEPELSKASGLAPAEEFILLESPLQDYALTTQRRMYPTWCIEGHRNFIDAMGTTPDAFLKQFGISRRDLAGKDVHAVHEWLRQYLDDHGIPYEDGPRSYRYSLPRQLLDAWRYPVPPAFADEKLLLRLLVDSATGVGYAELAVEGQEALQAFLQRAMTSGRHTLLGLKPQRVLIGKKLSKQYPGVAPWLKAEGIGVVHPSSGFGAGIHHIRLWQSNLRTGPEWDPGHPVSLDAGNKWLLAHAYAMGAAYSPTGDWQSHDRFEQLRRFGMNHFTGVTSVDAERFFAATGKGRFSDALDRFLNT